MTDKKIGQVYETTDYGKFKFISNNRPLKTSGAAWRGLIESLKRFGQLEPALVTPRYEIVNGQHRLAACKELGIPYRYTLGTAEASANHIADVNRSAAWGAKEYLDFYAADNRENASAYQFANALRCEFGLSATLVITLVLGGIGINQTDTVKDGSFKLSIARYEEIRRCLTDLFDAGFKAFSKERKMNSSSFWRASAYCWRHKGVNIKRMAKLLRANGHKVPSSTRVSELLWVFSTIYNKGLGKADKVYLDVDYNKGSFTTWEAK